MNTSFSARLPVEVVKKVQAEARKRHSTATAVVLEALERYFSNREGRLERDLRAALILTANALAGGDKEKAAQYRKAALELAERELEREREPCTPG